MSDNYSHTIQDEGLPALMDGEIAELELLRLLQLLPHDPELRARWARYQLVSSILQKQQYAPTASLEFADAVQVAIQKDFPFSVGSSEAEKQLLAVGGLAKSAARFAVAASVALLVVAGVQWQQRTSAKELLAATPATQNHAKPTSVESATTVPFMASKPLEAGVFMLARDKQYERYMQYNLERASLETGSRIAPLAPVADRINQRR